MAYSWPRFVDSYLHMLTRDWACFHLASGSDPRKGCEASGPLTPPMFDLDIAY